MILASIPSPEQGVWHLGPFPVRAYALCILIGVVVAIWLGNRRWIQRGGQPGMIGDIAVWAVPFGLVGARLYHVVTDPELYFDAGKQPVGRLLDLAGRARHLGRDRAWAPSAATSPAAARASRCPPSPTPLAPGIALAQAIGRWGNYFNQELYGRPQHAAVGGPDRPRPPGVGHAAVRDVPADLPLRVDLGRRVAALLVIWADQRFKLGHGRAFALYVMAYTVGRVWIEYLRVDTANHFLGLRLNEFTSVMLFLLAATYFVVSARLRPGREVVASPESSGDGPVDPSTAVEAPARRPGSRDGHGAGRRTR